MQISVLGMHRSGTSALARTLGLLGCRAGDPEDFPAADEANPKGYWERRDLWRLDEDLLAALGGAWDEVAHLDPESFASRLDEAGAEPFERRAREIVAALDSAGRPWVVKDPRLCLTFPLWRRALEAPIAVVIWRSPLSVARSLDTRDGFPWVLGMALWERYVRSALAGTRETPRLLVRYEDLIDRPRETARRLREDLESLGVRGLSDPADGELEAFLDPALERQEREPDLEAVLLNLGQERLVRSLERGDPDPEEPLSAAARDLLEHHAVANRRELALRSEVERLHALLAETTRNGERERLEFEQEVSRASEGAQQERRAREDVERQAAEALSAEREARKIAEETARESIAQASALQEKIARDSEAFALEHAERLRLEAVLAERF